MHNWILWKTMLVVHFAKDAANPLVSAVGRIGLGYGLAAGFSYLLAGSIDGAKLPVGLPVPIIICLSAGAGFLISGLLMLTTQAAQQGRGKSQAFQSVAALLPLARHQRWLLAVLPAIIVVGMVALFGGWLVAAAAEAMHQSAGLLLLAWLSGLGSGHGLLLLARPRGLVARGILFAGLLTTAIYLFDTSMISSNAFVQANGPWAITGLLLWPLIGYWQQYGRPSTSEPGQITTSQKSLIPGVLPPSWWFAIKLARNGRTRSAFVLALVLSGLMALSIVLRHKVFNDPYGLLTISAVLAATFGCEVRGIMRRHIPPELVITGGTRTSLRIETLTALLAGVMIGLPMLLGLHGQTSNSVIFLVYFTVLQCTATMLGLAAGTLLVPGSGETGTQFFAGILAITGLVMAPKIAHFSDQSYVGQLPYWLALSVACMGVINITERIRRQHYGRT